MINKQQFYTCNNICCKALLMYPKYFENSVPKFSLPGTEQLRTHNFIRQQALQLNLTMLCTSVIVNLPLLK